MLKPNFLLTLIAAALVIIAGEVWLYAQPTPVTQAPPLVQTPKIPQKPPPRPVVTAPRTSAVQPSVGTPSVSPAFIVANKPTTVTVMATVTGSGLIPASVNLLRLGATGTQPTILGVMQNSQGSLYSLKVSFDEPSAGQIDLAISASANNTLRRTLSSIATIPVMSVFTGMGFQFSYPASLVATPTTSTRPNALISTTLTDSTLQTDVTITTYSNSNALPLTTWYTQTLEGSEYSGSFSAASANPYILAPQQCNTLTGLLVSSEVFGYQAFRVFCPTLSGQVVEFEASAADGDPSPLSTLLQLIGSYSTF